ncbi:recombinase family protein [Gluconobacter japonicus]|uniref:recombinase family protein n=1 Tax=Gluconobacter japonicus TaxID=376620 RepID=UPI0024ACD7E6|nr:recombinase family protein [Gluconobacter japonicus]MDI6652473.1 recombinase family protein [Gluconobacter japonicus]
MKDDENPERGPITWGYARVSTQGQETDAQMANLLRLMPDKIVEEKWTGVVPWNRRPVLKRLIEKAERGDTIAVAYTNRIGRKTSVILGFQEYLEERGIKLKVGDLGLDTSTPVGLAMLQMMAVFAQLEHSGIKRNMTEGRKVRKGQGYRVGGPKHKLTKHQRESIRRRHEEGETLRTLAKDYGVSKDTIGRVVANDEGFFKKSYRESA